MWREGTTTLFLPTCSCRRISDGSDVEGRTTKWCWWGGAGEPRVPCGGRDGVAEGMSLSSPCCCRRQVRSCCPVHPCTRKGGLLPAGQRAERWHHLQHLVALTLSPTLAAGTLCWWFLIPLVCFPSVSCQVFVSFLFLAYLSQAHIHPPVSWSSSFSIVSFSGARSAVTRWLPGAVPASSSPCPLPQSFLSVFLSMPQFAPRPLLWFCISFLARRLRFGLGWHVWVCVRSSYSSASLCSCAVASRSFLGFLGHQPHYRCQCCECPIGAPCLSFPEAKHRLPRAAEVGASP